MAKAPSCGRPLRCGRLAHLAQDRLKMFSELHVADRSQGINQDVQVDQAQHQMHVLAIDMRLRLGSANLVGVGHGSADHRARARDPH
jgi:hypothetical protein